MGVARLVSSVTAPETVRAVYAVHPLYAGRFGRVVVYRYREGPSMLMAGDADGRVTPGPFVTGPDGTDASALAVAGYEIAQDEEKEKTCR